MVKMYDDPKLIKFTELSIAKIVQDILPPMMVTICKGKDMIFGQLETRTGLTGKWTRHKNTSAITNTLLTEVLEAVECAMVDTKQKIADSEDPDYYKQIAGVNLLLSLGLRFSVPTVVADGTTSKQLPAKPNHLP